MNGWIKLGDRVNSRQRWSLPGCAGCLVALIAGCGKGPVVPNSPTTKTAKSSPSQGEKKSPRVAVKGAQPGRASTIASSPQANPIQSPPSVSKTRAPDGSRSLSGAGNQQIGRPRHPQLPLPNVDDRAAAAAGLRKLAGKHVIIYTDLASAPEVEALPRVFDLAVPQWCQYFRVDDSQVARWKLIGCVMQNAERFRRAGLLPRNVPPFKHGYNRGLQFWLHEQPSAYYRRHLVLHEGTHGFMQTQLGGAGPPWYMEGTAELLATHRWHEGKLTLRYFPADKKETPEWGRIKIIKDRVAERKWLSLTDVMRYDSRAHLDVEPYAWCWGVSVFLDQHPRWQTAFRALAAKTPEVTLEFSRAFYEGLRADWRDMEEEWQLFVHHLDYGFRMDRAAIVRKPPKSFAASGNNIVRVAADRGWQSSGIRLQPGEYQLRATGRYQVGKLPKVWWCEPNGVTIRYYAGRPLGMLLAAVVDETQQTGSTPLLKPIPVGLVGTLQTEQSGTLYLCINESPAGLHDNAGELQVRVSTAP